MRRRTYQAWADIIDNPQFRNAKEMTKAMFQLPKAEGVVPKSPEGDKLEECRLIRNERTHEFYSIRSDRYGIVQHYQVIQPLIDAFEERNLTPIGSFQMNDYGRMSGYIFPEEDAYQKEILEDDPYRFGIRIFNSHDGTQGFGIQGVSWHLVCTNGLVHIKMLKQIKLKHFDKNKTMIAFSQGVDDILDGIPNIEKYIRRSSEIKVPRIEVLEFLNGIGVMPRMAEDIVVEIPNDVFNADKISLYDIHSAATAYSSHEGRSEADFMRISSKAESMLKVEDIKPIVEHGRELIELRAEVKRKKKEARQNS